MKNPLLKNAQYFPYGWVINGFLPGMAARWKALDRYRTITRVVLTAIALLWIGLPRAQAQKDSTELYVDAATGLEFVEASGFRRSSIRHYERKELGYNITFESDNGLRVAVYVYAAGETQIPNGWQSEAVSKQISEATRQIEVALERGTYDDAVFLSQGIQEFVPGADDSRFLTRSLLVKRKNISYLSNISLLGFQNRFVKVRSTYPIDRTETCIQELKEFRRYLGMRIAAARGSSGPNDSSAIRTVSETQE